jgi:opacity protein-like surface antigen
MVKQVVIVAGLMLLFASSANAGQSGEYVGISSGVMSLTSTTSKLTDRQGSNADLSYDKIGIPVSVFLGHQFGVGFRVEEEVFYKTATTDEIHYTNFSGKIDSRVWSIGAMTNLYYDVFHFIAPMTGSSFSPYVGAGVGFANVNMSEGMINGLRLWNSGNDTALAYQLAVGTGIPIYKDITLDLSYRYFGTTNITIDQIKTNYRNHNILLGLRYLFR